jgi:class 3 adenylate cyclase/tetratricopeptide (TPR) repeat protein
MPACPSCGEENPDRARFCWSCGAPLAEPPKPATEERKVVSVLFVDLVGFTAASEHADPEDVRARLRPYHARLKQEIERFGGTVEKFVGDAVMAVFGAPVTHEDDAERAVNAALRILAAIDELNEEHPGLELAVRGAVNTGEAMVMLGARPAEGEGIVAGDVVNTAARLQSAAPVGAIVVGETTYRGTRDLFEYEELEPVTVKGKAEPLPIWRATAARRRFGVDAEQRFQTPLIGRDDDLALLQTTYARTLREPSTQLVTIMGEPGVGKTRLTSEFRGWVDDLPDLVFWRQGRSLPYGEGITYWALGEMIKAQAGVLESDSPSDAAAKLAVAVAEVTEDPNEREWFRAGLAPLVGAGEGIAASAREEPFAAWRRFLESVAAQRPLIVVFEDLHWADDALLAFIEHLVDWSTGVPMLVLCTARPELYEKYAGWGGGKRNSNTISLSPLGPEETARLLSALLQRAVLPAETQARLLEHAGGNPLYAEEFVRMLADQGVLAGRGELRDADIRVPDTVQALIAARLDTLSPERKALLHDAAVVGKVFWSGAVASMGDRDEAFVRTGLHDLVRKELVRTLRTSSVKDQSEYAFWHALVRDVAYSQIPRSERVRKHVAAAEWIEVMAGERVTDHAELLAYHYEHALELARAAGADGEVPDLADSARHFLELAGDRAMSLDLSVAYGYYVKAAYLCAPDTVERGNLLLKAVLGRASRFDESEGYAREALAIFRTHDNELRQGAALVELSQFAYLRGDRARSDELINEAIELLERHPPGEELLDGYARRAGMLTVSGRPHEALPAVEQTIALADELGLDALAARMFQYRGIARADLGDLEGVNDIRAGMELSRKIGDVATAGVGYSNLASTLLLESPESALEVWDEGTDFAERRGIPSNMIWLIAESTWALFDLGRWDEVLRRAGVVIEWERSRGTFYAPVIAGPQKALVLLYRGRPQQAAPLVEEFLPRARDVGDLQVLVPALVAAAKLAVARDDLSHAAKLAREFEEATQTGAPNYRARYLPEFVSIALAAGDPELAATFLQTEYTASGRTAHSVTAARALIAEGTGDLDGALALHEEAASRWAEHGFVLGRAESLLGVGRCLVALGRPQEATPPLRTARELFQELGAEPSVRRTDDLLAHSTSVSA